jgi:drug/metabolite transporter (DMT)-like permease
VIVVAVNGFHPPGTGVGWLAVGAIAIVCTVLAILFFSEGLERVGAVRASVLSTGEPVFTVALAAIILGEVVTPMRVLGGRPHPGRRVPAGPGAGQTRHRPPGLTAYRNKGLRYP